MIAKHIQDSINYIESNLDTELTLSELAVVASYSEFHYSRLFKELVGKSPINYVRRRKISEAVYMKFSGHTLYDCAERYGFNSASTLSRALKSEFGCNYKEFVNAGGSIELQNRVELKTDNINWRIIEMNENTWINNSNNYGHSYPSAIYSALVKQGYKLDLTDVFGFSGFAFYTNVTKGLCPSAMSVFDFEKQFKLSLECLGIKATNIQRLWDKFDQKDEYRHLAVKEIKKALLENKYPICWDAVIPEWCLIVDYDNETDKFLAVYQDLKNEISPNLIGQREIEILDLTVINSVEVSELERRFKTILKFAIDHGNGNYDIDDNYKQGIKSFDLWSEEISRFLKEGHTASDEHSIIYHLNMMATSRYHAAIFIERYSDSDLLNEASSHYQDSALKLNQLLTKATMMKANSKKLSDSYLTEMNEVISQLKENEVSALELIKKYLEA